MQITVFSEIYTKFFVVEPMYFYMTRLKVQRKKRNNKRDMRTNFYIKPQLSKFSHICQDIYIYIYISRNTCEFSFCDQILRTNVY